MPRSYVMTNMTPYFYAIVAYFVLMVISKVAYTYHVSMRNTEKTIQEPKFRWNFNFYQLKQSLMSVWF